VTPQAILPFRDPRRFRSMPDAQSVWLIPDVRAILREETFWTRVD
jgi:hypothetical protein